MEAALPVRIPAHHCLPPQQAAPPPEPELDEEEIRNRLAGLVQSSAFGGRSLASPRQLMAPSRRETLTQRLGPAHLFLRQWVTRLSEGRSQVATKILDAALSSPAQLRHPTSQVTSRLRLPEHTLKLNRQQLQHIHPLPTQLRSLLEIHSPQSSPLLEAMEESARERTPSVVSRSSKAPVGPCKAPPSKALEGIDFPDAALVTPPKCTLRDSNLGPAAALHASFLGSWTPPNQFSALGVRARGGLARPPRTRFSPGTPNPRRGLQDQRGVLHIKGVLTE